MIHPIAAQLYTVRDTAARDFQGTLERVAAMGYLGVELDGLNGMAPAEFTAHVERLGLEVIGGHVPFPFDGEQPDGLADLKAIGCDIVICDLPEEHFATPESLRDVVDRYNRFAAELSEQGMTLGYHNHWWEFTPDADGHVLMTSFLERLDPRVFLEVDVYWVATPGLDVAATLADLGPRVRRLHVKDGPCNTTDPQTALGEGRVDVAGAIAAAPQSDWHVVELDVCAGDVFDALAQSYRYLTGKGLSRGRR